MFHCGESFGNTFHFLSNLAKCIANSFPFFKIGVFEGVMSHQQWNHIPWNLCYVVLVELVGLDVPGQIGHILPMGMWGGSKPQIQSTLPRRSNFHIPFGHAATSSPLLKIKKN